MILIGGGIHGVLSAIYYLKTNTYDYSTLTIIDPHPDLLASWNSITRVAGIDYLRSPLVHHLDVDAFSLQSYAKKNGRTHELIGQYARPSCALFADHAQSLIEELNLTSIHKQATVTKIESLNSYWKLTLSTGETIYDTEVQLSVGQPPIKLPKAISKSLYHESSRIAAVADVHKTEQLLKQDTPQVLILGQGMTAVQFALRLIQEKGMKPMLVHSHPFSKSEFDADPGWMGPKYLHQFFKTNNIRQRRNLISKARNRGSLNDDVFRRCRYAVNKGLIKTYTGMLESITQNGDMLNCTLDNGETLRTNAVFLALGFDGLPGETLLKPLAERFGKEFSPCGYPILSPQLEWLPGFFITGAAAELQLGPVARNIQGARMAMQRIIPYLKKKHTEIEVEL